MNGNNESWDESLLELRVACPECRTLLHTGVKANEKDFHEKDYSGTMKCNNIIGRIKPTEKNPRSKPMKCDTIFNWTKKDVKSRSS